MMGPNTAEGRAGAEFRAGQVLRRTFRVLQQQAVGNSLLCIATSMPIRVMDLLLDMPTGPHITYRFGAKYYDFYPGGFLRLPVILSSFALVPLGSAIILVATMRQLDGERLSLDEVFRQAASRYLPLLACTICWMFAVAGGCLLLIVPGLIVALVLSVSGQVCVAERLGPIASLSRSAALTRGKRWRILGFYVSIVIILMAIATAAGLAEASFGMVGTLGAYFLSGFAEAFRSTACAVQYVDLRISREGISTERIAAVFD